MNDLQRARTALDPRFHAEIGGKSTRKVVAVAHTRCFK